MFCTRFPHYMTDRTISLRSLKISDGPFLKKQFSDRDAPSYSLLSRPVSESWFHVWLKMKRTFSVACIIIADRKRTGFIGLYDLIAGKSAGMSLVIFDKEQRSRGHGSRAFDLLTQSLQTYSIVKHLFVEYKSDNAAARSFWMRCGFLEESRQDGLVTMSRNLP